MCRLHCKQDRLLAMKVLKLTSQEEEIVFRLAERITGSHQQGRSRRQVLVSNVLRRIKNLEFSSLAQYLRFIERDSEELQQLISALTIHTTSWFRERPHFERIEKWIVEEKVNFIKVLSVGCSTGEEPYSFAFLFEGLREKVAGFDYQIDAVDIDHMSIKFAKTACYKVEQLADIPIMYRKYMKFDHRSSQKTFSPSYMIQIRSNFKVKNVLNLIQEPESLYDLIICRNVLIYFKPEDVNAIIAGFYKQMKPGGLLCLGHSESIDHTTFQLNSYGNSVYKKQSTKANFDHFPVTPRIAENQAHGQPEPVGIDAIKELPVGNIKVIVIGASTGGPEALCRLLKNFSKNCPPVLVVQHISSRHAEPFAMRLEKQAGIQLGSIREGSYLEAGHLYIALGDYHIGIRKLRYGRHVLRISGVDPVNGHRPSVDYLFSTAKMLGNQVMAVLLTGMGKDGAEEMLEIKKRGGLTLAQDEKSSIVFGMPKQAVKLGGAVYVGNLEDIRAAMDHVITPPPPALTKC